MVLKNFQLFEIDSPMSEFNRRKPSRTIEHRFNSLIRHLCYKPRRSTNYVHETNDILHELNGMPSSIFNQCTISERLPMIIRNLITDLFNQWFSSASETRDEELLLLRNAVILFNRLIQQTKDVILLFSYLTDPTFIKAIATSLKNIDRLRHQDPTKKYFKQLTRLMRMFTPVVARLISLSKDVDVFFPVFEGTMYCLMSSSYDQVFRQLKPSAQILNRKQTFFLIECPTLLILYQGPQSQHLIEPIISTMIPRYASILDEHISSIHDWQAAMIHSVHHLLLTVIYGREFFSPYATGQPFQWFIDHIVRILSEPSLKKTIREDFATPQTILIDTVLKTLTNFVHEPDLLAYVKQLKITSLLRTFIHVRRESIVLHAYVLLSYVLDEDDIKASEKETGRLLSNIFDWLRKKLSSLASADEHDEGTEKNLGLLIEALQVLVQHDQVKSEILKQNALSFLINSCQQFDHQSKRLLLESLGSMTFDQEAARLLRDNQPFIKSMEEMQKTADNGIQKAAEKIMWNLVKEPERKKEIKKKSIESDDEKSDETKPKYQYDAMISYCHADKEIVYRIHQYLTDQGFKIWFDRDNIYGPAMQAMADAVENSEFVILCMSDSYKRSVYCQAEAEYAFRCKRRLLPLIVRQGYRADGWLGLIIGSRIYIDFTRLEYKRACELLLKEINLQRENQTTIRQSSPILSSQPLESNEQQNQSISTMVHEIVLPKEYLSRNTSRSKYRSISMEKWNQKDVLDFLYDCRLQYMMPLCELLNGQGLLKLFRICQHRPSRFYRQLNDELTRRYPGLHLPIGIFTQYLSEMDQLIDSTRIQAIEQDALQSKSSSPVVQQHSPLSSTIATKSPSTQTLIQTTSCNVQITEKTAFRTESLVTQSINV